MNREPAWSGHYFTIEFFELEGGASPAADFVESLGDADRAKVDALFARLCDHGRITHPEKFKKIEGSDGIFEFKSFQIRLFCFFAPNHRVVLLTGLRKKKDKHNRQDVQRAEAYKRAYLDRMGGGE